MARFTSELDYLADHDCTMCPLHEYTSRVCVMGDGPRTSKVMLIGEAPGYNEEQSGRVFSGAAGKELDKMLYRAGLDRKDLYVTNAVKCRPPENRTPERWEAKICSDVYVAREIDALDPTHILLLGNAALTAVAKKSGITKHRGVRLEVKGQPQYRTIMAAFHPAYALRNPGVYPVLQEDIRRFARAIQGEFKVVPVKTRMVTGFKGLRRLISLLEALPPKSVISYDTEDRYRPWHPEWSITCLGLTWDGQNAFVIPLYHPDSPFRRVWLKLLQHMREVLTRKDFILVAQSGKHDNVQLAGAKIFIEHEFDVMLAAHLIDENRPKNLGFLAQTYLGADVYKGMVELKPEAILQSDLRKLCEYNGYDVGYTWQLRAKIKPELQDRPRSLRLFAKLMMPASHMLQQVELNGAYVDQERLYERMAMLQSEISVRKLGLNDYISERLLRQFPGGEYNYRSTQQTAKVLFSSEKKGGLGLEPFLWTKTGNPSTNEEALQEYLDHPFVTYLFQLRTLEGKWMNTYLLPWSTRLDEKSRLHTDYKLYGTVTGRLSGDLQQVPRDSFIRSVFGAPPGWLSLEADLSQAELRIAAHVADEKRMKRAFGLGEDIHLVVASMITGLPQSEIGKETRKLAKAVDFGFLYGMYPKKFQKYAKINYGLEVSLSEAEVFRSKFFTLFPDLPKWHDRQRSIVARRGEVTSPLGRVRHLPNINSDDRGVRMEAERQAINSPVQSCASDLTLFAMVQLHKEVLNPREIRMVMTVHDSIRFEVREEMVGEYAPAIKQVMENLPLRRTFGANLSVPVVADVEWGTHWTGTPDASGLGFTDF
jgi:uracil-DNA glycosylase family 4